MSPVRAHSWLAGRNCCTRGHALLPLPLVLEGILEVGSSSCRRRPACYPIAELPVRTGLRTPSLNTCGHPKGDLSTLRNA